MALASCIECGKQISTEAKSCPNCGKGNPTTRPLVSGNARPIVAIVAIMLIIAVIGSMDDSSSSDSSSSSSYPGSASTQRGVTAVDTADIRRDLDSIARAYPITKLPEMPLATMALVSTSGSQYGARAATRAWWAAVEKESKRRQRTERVRLITESAKATCKSSQTERVSRFLKQFPEWSDETIGVVACRRIQMGMDAAQVRAALGAPDDINRSVGSFGVHEQWVYDGIYVYLEDGVVTSWQN